MSSPPSGYTYDVFISYSHANQRWVKHFLLPRLERAGLRVCVDYRHFEIGRPSLVNMERAVAASRHTLLVLTPAWVESQWTEFESLLVSQTDPAARARRLLPLMLEPCEPPPRIRALTYADFTRPRGRSAAFDQLLDQLRRWSGAEASVPANPDEGFSPFIAGLPVTDPRQFFGRERELRRLHDLLRRRPLQNAAVIGPRRSGKTSLLLYLHGLLTGAHPPAGGGHPVCAGLPGCRGVLVDFQDPRLGTREGLLRYLLGGLDLPAPRRCTLEQFLDLVTERLHRPGVILLDEMGVALRRYPELDDGFWESLRALATTQTGGNLGFVLAAQEAPVDLARQSGHGSPFFNIFGYTATLGPFTEPEARALLASSPIAFPDADVDWILSESGRWPLLLQILCRECLLTLEAGDRGEAWREEGRRQLAPFRYLLA